MNISITHSAMFLLMCVFVSIIGCKSKMYELAPENKDGIQNEEDIDDQDRIVLYAASEDSGEKYVPQEMMINGEYDIENRLVEKNVKEDIQDAIAPVEGVKQANKEALQEPTSHALQNSLIVYNYWENYLYRIYTSPQRVTAIRLSSREEIVGELIAGDTANWMIVTSQDRNKPIIYIKPIKEDISTNLIVNTTQRTYYLVLTSFPQTYMVSVEWRYPKLDLQEKIAKKNVLEEKVDLNSLYFGYKIIPYRKEPLWIPSKVFDDGVRTYIHFPNKVALSEYPALFMTDEMGNTVLINYRVINDYYVLDRILYRGELRIGTKKRDAIKIVRLRK